MPIEYNALDKKWLRPSLVIFCQKEPIEDTNNPGKWELRGSTFDGDYLYLTDDGRDAISVNPERIEYKQRMLNGRMRSYYVTDKVTLTTSWRDLPSRSQDNTNKYISEYQRRNTSIKYGAGQDIKKWYETYTGDFWMLLVYDGGLNTQTDMSKQVEKYNVFFEDFGVTVTKRGQTHDLWDVDITLVEA